jgi:predicted branched-subunit amino acid permease
MNDYVYGLKKSIPIALGYFAVSFSFGVMCKNEGISPLLSTIISATNVTSSGQYAGVKLISACASYLEIFLTVLLINLRYALMSLSLNQKLDSSIPTAHRLLFGFGITDEVYAVAISENKKITTKYMFGLITLPILFWTLGTLIGVLSSSIMPEKLLNALGISLYAMFIAIIIPDARRSYKVLFVILLSAAISCLFYYVPYINKIGLGFKIIISTIISSTIGALIFPIDKDVDGDVDLSSEKINDTKEDEDAI